MGAGPDEVEMGVGELRAEWLDRVDSLRQGTSGGGRAPHKPLLLLQALARIQNQGTSLLAYEDCHDVQAGLIADFGRPVGPTTPPHPEFPFTRMRNDGWWVVTTRSDAEPVHDDQSPSKLREADATGRIDVKYEDLLRSEPFTLVRTARKLLMGNWPESLHAEICDRVGLSLKQLGTDTSDYLQQQLELLLDDPPHIEVTTDSSNESGPHKATPRRDPAFRVRVLVAYSYQCAMCGWDGRIGASTVALEAAHVRWVAFDGPDDTPNGLCLCSLHHKLLDLGVLGISGDGSRINVSQHFVGRGPVAEEQVTSLAGRMLLPPQHRDERPDLLHVQWHSDQVFKHPARR